MEQRQTMGRVAVPQPSGRWQQGAWAERVGWTDSIKDKDEACPPSCQPSASFGQRAWGRKSRRRAPTFSNGWTSPTQVTLGVGKWLPPRLRNVYSCIFKSQLIEGKGNQRKSSASWCVWKLCIPFTHVHSYKCFIFLLRPTMINQWIQGCPIFNKL